MPGTGSLNSSVMELVLNAGPVAKFVLLLLGLFSVVCWALIVEKWWEFRKIRRESMTFLRDFREGHENAVPADAEGPELERDRPRRAKHGAVVIH